MLIKNVEILATKLEIKESKNNNKYLMITFIDLLTGDVFEVIEKDLQLLSNLKVMNKYVVDLQLTSSKYGLKLNIEEIKSNNGTI